MLIGINKHRIYLGIIVFLLIFSVQKFFLSKNIFETISSYLVYPIVKFQGKISDTITNYRNKNNSIEILTQKLNELKNDKEELLYENIRLKSSLGYLEQISELVEFRKKTNVEAFATCQIIHKNISDNGHSAFIDKGSSHGIEKDMVVIYKACLIGRVSDVYSNYSKIVYVTDASCKIAVYSSKTGATGIYEGLNNLEKASLNYVNHLQSLELNDLIISSGEGLIFPQGFAIGKINSFKKNQVHYDVVIEPLIDIKEIKYCQLIKK